MTYTVATQKEITDKIATANHGCMYHVNRLRMNRTQALRIIERSALEHGEHVMRVTDYIDGAGYAHTQYIDVALNVDTKNELDTRNFKY